MPSKISTFDFLRNFKVPTAGAHLYFINDPFIETFTKNRLKESLGFDLLTGNELTRNFLEERFLNWSLFSENKPILVLAAESINEKVLDFWLKEEMKVNDQLLILMAQKDQKIFAKLEAKGCVSYTQVEAPKFWEGAKMLDLVLQELSYKMAPVYKEFLLEKLEHSFESFYQALIKIQLLRPEGLAADKNLMDAHLALLAETVEENKVDFFKMIDTLNQNPRKFFYGLSKSDRDFDYYLSLALFMQGHFQKSAAPGLIREKTKLNQYDRQILETSESFNAEEKFRLEKIFAEMELMAKLKSERLKQFIRLQCMP